MQIIQDEGEPCDMRTPRIKLCGRGLFCCNGICIGRTNSCEQKKNTAVVHKKIRVPPSIVKMFYEDYNRFPSMVALNYLHK